MPADIIGTNVISLDETGSRSFRFEAGPIFANLVLADEINRATPKTQSALLEAMQEQTLTVAKTIHPLPQPFFVLATQNPMEMEGTYPLPEAQLDRFFFKLEVGYPSPAELNEILSRTTGNAGLSVRKVANDYIRYGSSPRGAQALVLAGKIHALLEGHDQVLIDDIRNVAHPA